MRLDIQTLNDHGFLVLNNFFEPSKLEPIHSNIQSILSDIFPNNLPQNAADAECWIARKSKLQRSKNILDLMNDDINTYLKNKLNIDVEPIKSCQIAARFPGEGIEKKSWHIDNFTEKDLNRNFIPKEFDYLVGIYLTDNELENNGNFTCFPGGHHQTRAYCRSISSQINPCGINNENIIHDYFRTNGLDDIRSKLQLGNEFQIKTKMGSVLVADRMLPHLICAPNLYDHIRIIIFFRTRLKNHSPKNLFFGSLHKESLTNKIELDGSGYMKEENVYRIKPRLKHHLPNTFASMVEIKFDNNQLISIHSMGFLSKESHCKWFDKLKNKSLIEIIEHINNVDYKDLIEEFYPMPAPLGELESTRMEFHHIHSLSKSTMIKNWYLGIEVILGKPGLITFNLPQSISQTILNRILAFHWNKKPKIIKNIQS